MTQLLEALTRIECKTESKICRHPDEIAADDALVGIERALQRHIKKNQQLACSRRKKMNERRVI
jgi:hypothetical protein